MASRLSVRPGFGKLVGAANPKFTVSEIPPKLPKSKDLWLCMSNDTLYYWKVDTWVQVL